MNIYKKTPLSIILMVVCFLTACSPVVTPAPNLATSATEAQPTETSAPKVEYTPTYVPTATTQAHSDNLTRDCAKIISGPPSDVQLAGLLVIKPYEDRASSYLLDLSTGNKTSLGRSFRETVSPNGKLLAYADLDTGSIVIADNTGKKIRTVPDPDERLNPAYWLDNQHLSLDHRQGEFGGPYMVSSMITLDPLTGNMQEQMPEFPNLDTFFSPLGWAVSTRFLINPELTHVIYQAREDYGSLLILWDINAKKEIARIPGVHVETPWWSPDGTKIVIGLVPKYIKDDNLPFVDGGDLFTLDATGKFERLTYLTTVHYAVEMSYTWSPDGKSIAFMLQVAPDNKNIANAVPELSILDMETRQVTNLCIPGGGLTWSPDGKYMLINQGLNDGKEKNEVYLVDLENKSAWKVAENAEGRGWMIEQP
ncbi:MAG: hypothetical protein CVU44_16795 [Chloroflexi bacterium HGW-Chloroflexi-6]|nr:MAG: hypothetical protein CVU44_16795 [Chloroflexi bacterium HGW-Chloroflexi-6]